MAWALDPVELSGARVSLRSYERSDIGPIADAIDDPAGWFGRRWGYDTPLKTRAMLERILAARDTHNPMVCQVGDEIVGITRLLRLEPANKSLEIGGTWIAPKWQKTFVNTEMKLLLL